MGRGKEGYRGRRWGEEGKRVGKGEREKEVGGRGGRGERGRAKKGGGMCFKAQRQLASRAFPEVCSVKGRASSCLFTCNCQSPFLRQSSRHWPWITPVGHLLGAHRGFREAGVSGG